MAQLTDLEVYNKYAYSTMTRVLRQQIELFNSATNGCLVLSVNPHQGDFDYVAAYKRITGLVRSRDAHAATGTSVSSTKIEQDSHIGVKVARAAGPVEIPPSQWSWIQRSPEEAGAVHGQQLAIEMLADKLNTLIMCLHAAMSQNSATEHDVSGESGEAALFRPISMNKAVSKFGDRSGDISCWVAHSKQLHDYWGNSLLNTERLFTFGTVNVTVDSFGRPIVMTDAPALINETPDPDEYHALGLVPGAAMVHENGDLFSNIETNNGNVNIERSIQTEWTYTLKIKEYSWDTTNGGASPTDAALATATNWDSLSTEVKDQPGVLLKTQ